MDTIEFFVDGKPVGKQRPKFNSKQRRTYTPKKTKNWEEHIQNIFKQFDFHKIPSGIPVFVSVYAYFIPPKSWSKHTRTAYMRDNTLHTSKPDCDNVLKCVLDALNGLAYEDDKQVYGAFIVKRYDQREGLSIRVKAAEEGC